MNKFEQSGYRQSISRKSENVINYGLGFLATAYLKISDTFSGIGSQKQQKWSEFIATLIQIDLLF